ncbi:nucleotidyltransferase family protein [Polynucleobacter sp. MG-Unter2-18]|uniref:nucleotidyltransferase family protein n=1 Tax=Polynucleobacter sp. MG-Unter2-18 TaxID=2081052 RepID=UPI001BFD1610|nr:nucleotidyltransferase family protein [Polynucleobacter sp. MG-Unter2-18]QWD95475.1 nucleotidyltransferase family protein [Polynucleobacter sp. MG-Unter2-18]
MTSSSPSAHDSQLRIAALLLAAGEGSRLGSHPKALLHRDGKTLLELFSSAIQGFSPVECIVVTGFHAQLIESEIAKMNTSLTHPMKIIRNGSPEEGQPSSVRLGLESLRTNFDVLLVALSDQPEVGAKEIQELLDEYAKREDGQEIILPMVDGRRGNPVLFSYQAVLDVLAQPGMVCRDYMDTHHDKVRAMHTSNQAFVMDVDTPEDIQRHKLKRFSF